MHNIHGFLLVFIFLHFYILNFNISSFPTRMDNSNVLYSVQNIRIHFKPCFGPRVVQCDTVMGYNTVRKQL